MKELKMHDIYDEGKIRFVGLVPGLSEPVTNIFYLLLILCAGYVLLKHGLPIIKSVTGTIISAVSAAVALLFLLLFAHNLGLVNATPVFDWLSTVFPVIARKQ